MATLFSIRWSDLWAWDWEQSVGDGAEQLVRAGGEFYMKANYWVTVLEHKKKCLSILFHIGKATNLLMFF